MPSESVIEPSAPAIDRYFQTAYERQRIWRRRFLEHSPGPWTDDPILAKYHFTNVYRELDRGTVHYGRHVIDPLTKSGASDGDVFAATVAYRWFNRVETWDRTLAEPILAGRFDSGEIEARLRAQDGPVFTSAHMVCAYDGYAGDDKIARVCGLLDAVFANRDTIAARLKTARWPLAAFKVITSLDGIAGFNGYEIYSDLLYWEDRFFPWDENAWANVGPGAGRGLKVIFPGSTGVSHLGLMEKLRDEQRATLDRLGLSDFYSMVPGGKLMTLRNIEHWCCEFFKYNRGSCKGRFAPQSGPELYAA
jgi:hypothetical protein